MIIANGSQDVTQYFVLRDSTTHAPKTDVTITDIDLYYLEQGAAMAAKVDATALAAADSAHDDNKAFHCGQGLYRIDWPDAAFDGGVGKRLFLIVVCTGVDTSYLEIELSPAANVKAVSDDATAADTLELFAEALKQDTGQLDDGTFAAGAVNAAAIADGAIDNATFAADVGSTAYATNIIALAVRKVLDELNLNHLLKDATAGADMTTEVADNTILARVLANGDTSAFDPSTDGLQPIKDAEVTPTAASKTGYALSATGLDLVVKLKALLDGTPSGSVATDAGNSASAFKTDLTEATDDHYNKTFVVFYSGALTGQSRKVAAVGGYVGLTKVLTFESPFTDTPADDDDFLIIGRSE